MAPLNAGEILLYFGAGPKGESEEADSVKETESKPKKKILVVDDEEETFEFISQILSPLGYDLSYAENGTVGFIMAKNERPNLIILDITMPLMDGFEVQRLLKEYEPTRSTPVLFLTGSTIFQYKPLALEQGAVGYMQKPVDEEQFAKNVQSLLSVGEQLDRLQRIKSNSPK